MVPPPPIDISASSSAKAGDAQGGNMGGNGFHTGYFGTGADWSGLLEKSMIPLAIAGVVLVVWLKRKK